eukprot:7146825-Karenia_brevis.AAC.1
MVRWEVAGNWGTFGKPSGGKGGKGGGGGKKGKRKGRWPSSSRIRQGRPQGASTCTRFAAVIWRTRQSRGSK